MTFNTENWFIFHEISLNSKRSDIVSWAYVLRTMCHHYPSQNWRFQSGSTVALELRCNAFGWGTALQGGRLQVWLPLGSLKLFIDPMLLAALWPWGRLSLEQKWVPGTFPGGTGDWCLRLKTLPPSCPDCLKILAATTYSKQECLFRRVQGLVFLLVPKNLPPIATENCKIYYRILSWTSVKRFYTSQNTFKILIIINLYTAVLNA
jgi:hypothetical protein